MKVYLAGKIGKNDWRHSIFKGLRDSEMAVEKDLIQEKVFCDKFEYNGPYFISCDHGCYHGENLHGRGKLNDGCEENGDSHKNTLEKCLKWIETSDLIFVWLDSKDAYGTISEIGYAKALNKPIYLAIDKKMGKEVIRDLWFIQQMANKVNYFDTAQEAWATFSSLYDENSNEPFSYIMDENNLRWLKTKITEFCNYLTRDPNVNELNNLDRVELVKEFLEKKKHDLKKRFGGNAVRTKRFKNDVAIEIDFKIVRGYFKNTTNAEAKALKTWRIEGTNLLYKYNINYEREKELAENSYVINKIAINATPKQIDYINNLLRRQELQLSISAEESLDMQEASEFIQHLIANKPLPDDLKKHTLRNKYVYNKTEAIKLINEKSYGIISHPIHNFLIIKFEAENDLEFYDGTHFTAEWVDYLIHKLSKKETYEALKEERKQWNKSV